MVTQGLEIDALKARLDTAEPEIDALEEADGEQDTKISDLEGSQGTLASDVGTLKTDLDAAELLITDNADDISDLGVSLPVYSYIRIKDEDDVLVPNAVELLSKVLVFSGEIIEISAQACFEL